MDNFVQQFTEKGLPFIQGHWELFAGLLVILIVIFIFEKKTKANNAESIDPQTAVEWINRQNAIVIDIRDREAFRKGHIINSESIEPANVVSAITQAEKYRNNPVLIVCAQGLSAMKTAAQLKKEGWDKVAVLKGGIQAWVSADLPLEKK